MKIYKLLFAFYMLVFQSLYANSGESLDVFVDTDRDFIEKPLNYIWGTDPFMKTPGFFNGEPKEEKLTLSAIVHSEDGRSIAVINNQSAFVNSKINGHVIKQIGSNFVVLEKNHTLQELQLSPVQQKQSADISIWDRLPAANSDDEADPAEDSK